MDKLMAKVELFRTPNGRYVWWQVLMTIDFIPKGKQRASHKREDFLPVYSNQNTFDGAMKKALRHALTLTYKEE
jgi:hypothetical protein